MRWGGGLVARVARGAFEGGRAGSVGSGRSLWAQVVTVTTSALCARLGAAAVGIISTGMLVRRLTQPEYGAYALILSLAGFLSFMDQGLAVGVRTLVAQRRADEAAPGAYSAIRGGLVLVSMVTGGLLCTMALIIAAFDVRGALSAEQLRLTLWGAAFMASTIVLLPGVVWMRALDGLGLSAVSAALPLLAALALLASTTLGIVLGAGLGYFVVMAACSVAPGLVVSRRMVRARISTGRVDRSMLRRDISSIWSTSWPMVIISLMLSASYTLDPVVISMRLGLRATASYSIASKLAIVGTLVVTAAYPVLWTHYARARGALVSIGRREWLLTTAAFLTIGIFLGLLLIAAGVPAAAAWSHGRLLPGRALFSAFASFGVLLAFHLPSAGMLTSPSDLRFQAVTTTMMASLNVPLSVVLADRFGIAGPVWASVLALALCHVSPVVFRAYARVSR